jgi:Tfp pilus assembly protein PilN
MLRTNLATRPFYNERAVHFWLFVAALVVVAATIFNVTSVLRYSQSDTQLATEASSAEARATELHQQAIGLRATVDPKQVEFASVEARQANDLIDRRTFSWTDLLNKFEVTLPDDVRIVSVRPRLERGRGMLLTIAVVARGSDDVNEFMESLEKTGEFTLAHPPEEHVNEQNLLESTLEMIYLPAAKPAGAPPS